MKRLAPLFLFLLLTQFAFSQKIPKYDYKQFLELGWQTDECSFDPDADAILLYKDYTYDFIISTNTAFMKIKHKRLLKILNDDGIEEALLEYRYYSHKNIETIKLDKGIVFNRDDNGKVTEQVITKENTFVVNETDHYSVFKVTPPNVKAGSIIYLEYTVQTPSFKKHYYQEHIPIIKSVMNASFETDLTVNISNHVYQPFNKIETFKGNRKEYFVEVDSLIGLTQEPFQHNVHLYRQKANLIPTMYGMKSIKPSMGNVLYDFLSDDDFRRRLNSDVTNDETEAILAEAKTLSSDVEKAKLIYNYVKDNYEASEKESINLDKTLAQVIKQKKGTGAELSALLQRLMQKAGLNANFYLTTTNNELPYEAEWPSINDFSVLSVILKLEDKVYILNPMYRYLPFELTARNLMYTPGIYFNTSNYNKAQYIQHFIDNAGTKDVKSTNVMGEVSADGNLKAKVLTTYIDYANVDFLYALNKDSLEYINDIKTENKIEITSDSEVKKNNELSSSLGYDISKALEREDGFYFQSMNLFMDFNTNPFTSPIRKTGIFFQNPLYKKLTLFLKLDPSLEIESLPKNIRLTNEEKNINFTRRVDYQDGTLRVSIDIAITKTLFGPDEYEMFYEFWKTMFDQLNELIAIKKK